MTDPTVDSPQPAPRKMGWLTKIAAGIIAIIAGFLGYIAVQPAEFHVERSATIAASADVVFAEVNDFRRWDAWSPWSKLDPQAKASFSGAETGVGAIFNWSGNDEIGEGSMTIVDSKPSEQIAIRLDFVKPMEDTANVLFTFQPQGEATRVTWAMSGKNNFVGRCFCFFMNMDKMIGDKYDEGLSNLKKVAENSPQ